MLRQKLTEREEEKGQLERKVTELSATVSSTLASYTFLEQALAAESAKYDPEFVYGLHVLRNKRNCASKTFLSMGLLTKQLKYGMQMLKTVVVSGCSSHGRTSS